MGLEIVPDVYVLAKQHLLFPFGLCTARQFRSFGIVLEWSRGMGLVQFLQSFFLVVVVVVVAVVVLFFVAVAVVVVVVGVVVVVVVLVVVVMVL